jgi:hypothetical protein
MKKAGRHPDNIHVVGMILQASLLEGQSYVQEIKHPDDCPVVIFSMDRDQRFRLTILVKAGKTISRDNCMCGLYRQMARNLFVFYIFILYNLHHI